MRTLRTIVGLSGLVFATASSAATASYTVPDTVFVQSWATDSLAWADHLVRAYGYADDLHTIRIAQLLMWDTYGRRMTQDDRDCSECQDYVLKLNTAGDTTSWTRNWMWAGYDNDSVIFHYDAKGRTTRRWQKGYYYGAFNGGVMASYRPEYADSLAYDDLGRPKSHRSYSYDTPRSAFYLAVSETLSYAGSGRTATVSGQRYDSYGFRVGGRFTESRTYDEMGRPISETRSDSAVTTTKWDANGRFVSRHYGEHLGLVNGVNSRIDSVARDGHGNLIETRTMVYDTAYRDWRLLGSDYTVSAKFDLTYDAEGLLASRTTRNWVQAIQAYVPVSREFFTWKTIQADPTKVPRSFLATEGVRVGARASRTLGTALAWQVVDLSGRRISAEGAKRLRGVFLQVGRSADGRIQETRAIAHP